MSALQHLVRVFRIGAIVTPVAAGIGYAVIYGIDHWFKLGCREADPVGANHLLAAVWLVLAVLQVVGYRSRPGGLDIWKIIVIGISALGIYACWEMYFLPPWDNNCQDISTYDYADDFLGVDGVLILLCIPVTAVSGFVAMVAAIKWQMRKDAEGTSPW